MSAFMGVGSLQDRLKLRSRLSANAAAKAEPVRGGACSHTRWTGTGAGWGGRGDREGVRRVEDATAAGGAGVGSAEGRRWTRTVLGGHGRSLSAGAGPCPGAEPGSGKVPARGAAAGPGDAGLWGAESSTQSPSRPRTARPRPPARPPAPLPGLTLGLHPPAADHAQVFAEVPGGGSTGGW